MKYLYWTDEEWMRRKEKEEVILNRLELSRAERKRMNGDGYDHDDHD